MEHCETCGWWRKDWTYPADSNLLPWGVCLTADRQQGVARLEDRQFYVRDGFMTCRSDFGCVLHEAKLAQP